MKKVISFILAVITVLCLCACGTLGGASTSYETKDPYEDVKRELIGSWNGDIDADFVSGGYDSEKYYTTAWFDFESDGSVSVQARLCRKKGGTIDTKLYYGTYTVANGKITINYTSVAQVVDSVVRGETSYSGSDTLQYKLQNGMLSVYFDGTELEKE